MKPQRVPLYLKESLISRPINHMRPVHPGEILREDFLAPLEMSVNALALALGVPATWIHSPAVLVRIPESQDEDADGEAFRILRTVPHAG